MIKIGFVCLFVVLFATPICFAKEDKLGSIFGKWITDSNGPMTGAQVLLFDLAVAPPPSSDKYLRVPDAKTTIDNSGKFSVKIAAGRYHLVMRKRANGRLAGPPQDGDLHYYSRDKEGKAMPFIVIAGAETDLGTISEATVFKKRQLIYEKGMTAIEGTVINEKGLPVEGVQVLVYTSKEIQGKPKYVSESTDKEGKYLVFVASKGSYYLGARNHYGGGKPVNGEFMGGHGEITAPTAVEVIKGEITKGINITIQKFAVKGRPE